MLTLKSPAKVNLFLKILRRRPDGYHELASLFQAINLFDTLHFKMSQEDSLTCTDPSIPTDGANLVWKAVDLFRQKTQLTFPVNIHLEKNIPHQAGLGGGSSNAATTLWALNQLCGEPATIGQLQRWSGEIGSDVTFFLSEGTSYCTGRGEILQSLPSLPTTSLWIVKPLEGLPTNQVYQNLDVSALEARDPQVSLEGFLSGKAEYFNDLEVPAFRIMPKLLSLKMQLLREGFKSVTLCGSGSSLFCFGNKQPSPIQDCRSYAAQFVNRLHHQWF